MEMLMKYVTVETEWQERQLLVNGTIFTVAAYQFA